MSRTPSPPHIMRESFGRGGARGGSHTLGRPSQNKRDSRDLDGWSRQDNFDRSNPRRDDLWDPRGKPPSGRPKSAVVKSSLPPRFQRNREGEEIRMERESVGRDVLGELRDSFPPCNERRDGPMSSSWAGVDRRRMDSSDSMHSKDVSGVSDWSVEVEEEDERRSQAGTLDRCMTPMSDRQTISPPSRALSPSSRATLSPRAISPDFNPRGGHAGGLIKLPDSMSNPHWRPPPDSRHPAWRRDDQDWRSGSQPQSHYPAPTQHWSSAPSTPSSHFPPPIRGSSGIALYDARNPTKPTHRDMVSPEVQSYPNPRFPLEPSRFATPSHMLPPHIPPGPGYRPPFPQRMYAGTPSPSNRPTMAITPPDWYDVFNSNIYGAGKTDINCIAHIVRADMKLRSVLQGGPAIVCSRWDQEVRETRHQIMAAARFLMKNDMMFVAEREVEIHIWKTVYYQVIEMLKASYFDVENTTPENRKTLKASLMNLFDEGVDYYTQLLTDLSTTYRIDLELYYDPLEPREGVDRLARLARMSAQKCLLCLGDLARYREQVNSSSNYGRARQFYSKANHLDMRNGRPFNMLAILAKMNHRRFEAVYYHVRCLSSRNPFQSSKEGLVTIFAEMTKRWEMGEKRRGDERREGEREREGRRIVRGSKVRREVWERPGGRRLHRTTSAQSGGEELANMSVADLNKRFINTFLYLQGKLFTQINTEDFPAAQASLLDQFRVLISKSPLPLSTDRLVQIMALNMYIIEETKLRADSANPTCRSVCQDLALSLAGDMFGLLLERCNLLVARGDPGVVLQAANESQEDQDLCNLLAPVKVWCDWLLGNNDTWYPLVSAEPFAQLAQLATRLEDVKSQVNAILEECLSENSFIAQPQARREEFALIKLAEDALLCEFTPWFRGLSWESYRLYCPRNLSIPRATAAKRVSQILLAVECLEGLDQPVLKWSLPDNSHVCLVTDSSTSREHFSRDIAVSNLTAMIARDEYVLEESYSGEEDVEEEGKEKEEEGKESDSETDSEIGRLRERKEELERARRKEQARARKAQREILSEVVSVTLHIRPRILVPDTNILVDSLESIKELAESGDWLIRIPTTVVIELEGLAKSGSGIRTESDSAEHIAEVRDNSRTALAWLREKPSNIKCVTTKGTILANFGVISEEDGSDGQKNDDKILSCCLSLNSGPPPTVAQEIKTVYRDTVLITDDRNLKLKAHTADCAVNTIKEFMSWVDLKK